MTDWIRRYEEDGMADPLIRSHVLAEIERLREGINDAVLFSSWDDGHAQEKLRALLSAMHMGDCSVCGNIESAEVHRLAREKAGE